MTSATSLIIERWSVQVGLLFDTGFPELINITASTLLRKMTHAIPQAVIHHRAFSAFTESLDEAHPGKAPEWESAVVEWEIDHRNPCPYDLPEQSMWLLSA